MRVSIQALAVKGHNGIFRARRFWSSSEATIVDVLAQEDDPPDQTIDVIDGQTQQREKRVVPDKARIGQKSYRQIKEDGRLRILADGETAGVLSQKALDEAIRTAGEATAEAGAAEPSPTAPSHGGRKHKR